MANIAISQAQAEFTNVIVGLVTDAMRPTTALQAYFPDKKIATKYVSIAVKRYLELVATDVPAQGEGTYRMSRKGTIKEFYPPVYKINTLLSSEIDMWDRLLQSNSIEMSVLDYITEQVATEMQLSMDSIERAVNAQIAEIFNTGTVTFTNADSIDYKRRAELLVANSAGNTFATPGVDPFVVLGDLCQQIKIYGKTNETTFDAWFGSTAIADLRTNSVYLQNVTQNLNNNINNVTMPTRSQIGSTWHGQLSCGNFKVNIYTYNETYDLADGTRGLPLLDAKKVTIVPQNPGNFTARGTAPQSVFNVGSRNNPILNSNALNGDNVMGKYQLNLWGEIKGAADYMQISSRPLAVLQYVDRMGTVQVVA